jgi:phage FluMu protein Com
MQISNDRYFDDRQRHDLALRMIRHEARTCTIRMCTGLTDDRIRRLYQAYVAHSPSLPTRRRRGKSPRQVAYFTRTAQLQFEASLLAGAFVAFGLLNAPSAPTHVASALNRATTFCDAYETHLQMVPSSTISFEHAWFLLQILARTTELSFVRCRHCDGQFLHARTDGVRRKCPACALVGKSSGVRQQLRTAILPSQRPLGQRAIPAAPAATPTATLGT